MTSSEKLHKQNQACLELFVLRARRVEAHSLLADLGQVLRWASHGAAMEHTPDGRTFWTQKLPPEELLESLAARVRPLILQDDPIQYGKVLSAIGFLLGDEDRAAEMPTIKQLRKEWNQVHPNNHDVSDIRAYSAQVTDVNTGQTSLLTSDQLAFAWIYGDTVHADAARQAQAEQFGIKERYRAAAAIVAELAMKTIATLNYVRILHSRGKLTLPEALLSREVIVTQTEFRDEVQLYVTDPDTPPPSSLTDTPGPEWRLVTDPNELRVNAEEAQSSGDQVTIQIRPTSPTDHQVQQLIEDPSAAALAVDAGAFAPPRGAFYAAWIGDRAIGCVGVRERTETEAEINMLTVIPEAQGSLLGRHLLEAAEGAAQHLRYAGVLLNAHGSNDEALAYLQSSAYEEMASHTDDTGTQWFRKSLTGP